MLYEVTFIMITSERPQENNKVLSSRWNYLAQGFNSYCDGNIYGNKVCLFLTL